MLCLLVDSGRFPQGLPTDFKRTTLYPRESMVRLVGPVDDVVADCLVEEIQEGDSRH